MIFNKEDWKTILLTLISSGVLTAVINSQCQRESPKNPEADATVIAALRDSEVRLRQDIKDAEGRSHEHFKRLTCLVCRKMKKLDDQMCYDAGCVGQFEATIHGRSVRVMVVADTPLNSEGTRTQGAVESKRVPLVLPSGQTVSQVEVPATWAEAQHFEIIAAQDAQSQEPIPVDEKFSARLQRSGSNFPIKPLEKKPR